MKFRTLALFTLVNALIALGLFEGLEHYQFHRAPAPTSSLSPAAPQVSHTFGDFSPGRLLPVSPVQGDIPFFGSSAWTNLAPGTTGQVLKTQGASANPVWTTLPTSSTVASGLCVTGRPSAAGTGNLFLCKDVPVIYFDNPSTTAWEQFAIGGYNTSAGLTSAWTVTGTLGLVQKGDSILATAAGLSTGQINTLTQAIPSGLISAGSWVVQADGYLMGQTGAGYPEFGAAITNGTNRSTSTARYMARYEFAWGWEAVFCPLNSQSRTVLRAFDNSFGSLTGAPIMHTRLFNDGTTLFYQISGDGEFWRSWISENTPVGYTQFGAMVGADTSTGVAAALIESMRAIAPTTYAITAASGNGVIATITCGAGFPGLQTGMGVSIHGMTGGTGTPPNGTFDITYNGTGVGITVLNATQFTVVYTPAFTYGSGGTVFSLSQ